MKIGNSLLSLVATIALGCALPATAGSGGNPVKVDVLASGLAGSIGGTIGPDGALYVPQFALGTITRIDPDTGAWQTYASGLPLPALAVIGFPGGVFDLVFRDGVAWALVTLVDAPQFFNDVLGIPDTGANGLYRCEAWGSCTLVADLGAFSRDNAPTGFDYVLPEGVQYAIETVPGGFLVTDGHLNRVLFVTPSGQVSVLRQYGNVVPSGIDVVGDRAYLAETGPITGSPGAFQEIGRVTRFDTGNPAAGGILAGGISMAVDVQAGPGKSLYALSQGIWDPTLGPDAAGFPALPFTGELLRIRADGSTDVIVEGLLLPTSLHFIGGTAYIVTLAGDVLRVRGLSGAERP